MDEKWKGAGQSIESQIWFQSPACRTPLLPLRPHLNLNLMLRSRKGTQRNLASSSFSRYSCTGLNP